LTVTGPVAARQSLPRRGLERAVLLGAAREVLTLLADRAGAALAKASAVGGPTRPRPFYCDRVPNRRRAVEVADEKSRWRNAPPKALTQLGATRDHQLGGPGGGAHEFPRTRGARECGASRRARGEL